MAKRSKHLGLGNAAKAKKQKNGSQNEVADAAEAPAQSSNEITVELNEEVDADDEIAQLQALWKTYAKSEKENELVLNGIIHECDRILRNSGESGAAGVPDYFHSIYALALADLALFHTGEEDSPKKVAEFFDAALERIELGLDAHAGSDDLLFAKSRILINRVPLQHISTLTVESEKREKDVEIEKLVDEAIAVYEAAEKGAIKGKTGLFNEETLTFLEALDDLLDMVDNFGHESVEDDEDEEDGEEDDEEDEDENQKELSETHPLYNLKADDKYNQWWRDHTVVFLDQVDAKADPQLHRELCKRLGQSYLLEAEIPSSVYTTLTYDDDYAGIEELQGLTKKESQEISKKLFKTAVEYFQKAEDKEDPETWVPIAEAKISLGNLYDLESAEQEELYVEAEKILRRANKATQGKYQDILDNLLE